MSWPVPGDPPRLWAESNILLWFNKNLGHKLGQVKLNKHDLKIRFLDWADGQGTGYHNSDNFLFKLITLERALRSHHQVPKFKFLDTQTAFALCLWVSERVSAVQLSRPSLKLKIRVTLCPFKYPKYWLFLEMNCSISTIIMLFSSTKAVWLGLFTNNENWKTI